MKVSSKERQNHPLVGTWEQKGENPTCVVYTISLRQGNFAVSGIDVSDGEKLKISSVRWNGRALTFTSVCPSTSWKVEHVFRVKRPGLADHQITYTESETWKKQRKSAREAN